MAKEDLSVGIPGMDEEHQRFFRLVEELDAAIAAHRGPHDIERCLLSLIHI